MSEIVHTETLDIERLETERIHRLKLHLLDDALGFPIALPMLVARGRRDGPVFGLTAAVHGNELNGIPVIHELFRSLDLRALRGSLVAVVVVNVPGYLAHRRQLVDGVDLNKSFPGKAKGNVPERYAHRFLNRVVKKFDRLCDLHTASFGRINSLYVRADLGDPVAHEMALLLRPQLVLHSPPHDGTLRAAAERRGVPCVTLEIGDPQRFQSKMIRSSLAGIRRLLVAAGNLPPRAKPVLGQAPIFCDRSRWLYTDHGGLLEVGPELLERVEAKQVIARLYDVFGDVVQEYRAREAGVVIGKSVNPAGGTGARIAHIGRVVDASHFGSG